MLKGIIFSLVMFLVLKATSAPDLNFLHYAIGMCIGGIILLHLNKSEK